MDFLRKGEFIIFFKRGGECSYLGDCFAGREHITMGLRRIGVIGAKGAMPW